MTYLNKVEVYTTPQGFAHNAERAIAIHLTRIAKDINGKDLSLLVMEEIVKQRDKVRAMFDELDALEAKPEQGLGDRVVNPSVNTFVDPHHVGNGTAFDPIVPDGWYLVKAVQPHEQRVLPSQVLEPLGMHAYRVEFGRINRDISVSGEGDTLAEAWREGVEEVERYEIARMK